MPHPVAVSQSIAAADMPSLIRNVKESAPLPIVSAPLAPPPVTRPSIPAVAPARDSLAQESNDDVTADDFPSVKASRRTSTQLLDHTYVQHMSVPTPDLRPTNSTSRLPASERTRSNTSGFVDLEPAQSASKRASVPVIDEHAAERTVSARPKRDPAVTTTAQVPAADTAVASKSFECVGVLEDKNVCH